MDTDTPSCPWWQHLSSKSGVPNSSVQAEGLCYTIHLLTSVKEVITPWVNIYLQIFAGRNVAQCLGMWAVESDYIAWV